MRKLLLIALATLSLNCEVVIDNPSGNNDDNTSDSNNSSNNTDDGNNNEDDANNTDDQNGGGGDDCESCTEEALNGACKSAAEACDANEACGALLQCLSDCAGDDNCVKGCMEDNKDGQDDYFKTMDCLFCGECTDACDTAASCEGSNTGGGGGGDAGGDACDQCVDEALSNECADAKAACDANPACGELGQCYSGCDQGDDGCFTNCDDQHGEGKDDFMGVLQCLYGEACAEECK